MNGWSNAWMNVAYSRIALAFHALLPKHFHSPHSQHHLEELVAALPGGRVARQEPLRVLVAGHGVYALRMLRSLRTCGQRLWIGLVTTAPDDYAAYSCYVDGVALAPRPEEHLAAYVESLRSLFPCDLVIPCCEETYYIAEAKQRGMLQVGNYGEASDRLPMLLSPNLASLLELGDKLTFNKLCGNVGVANVPKTYSPGHALVVPEVKYILKPRMGRGGHENECVEVSEGEVLSTGKVIQEFVDGSDVSSFSFAVNGHIFSHLCYQGTVAATHAPGFSLCRTQIDSSDSLSIAGKIAAATSYTGFFGIDFRLSSSGNLHPIECNPRMTNGIHFLGSFTIGGSPLSVMTTVAKVQRIKTFLGVFLDSSLLTTSDDVFDMADPVPFMRMLLNLVRVIIASVFISCQNPWDAVPRKCANDDVCYPPAQEGLYSGKDVLTYSMT